MKRVLPGFAICILHSESLPSCFDKASEKYNGWIKSYELKVSFLAYFGYFGVFFLPFLSPWGHHEKYFGKSQNVFTFLSCCNFMQNFRKIQWLPVEKS